MTLSRIVTGIWMGLIDPVGLTAQIGCSTRAPSVAIRMTDTVAPDMARRMTQRYGQQAETQLSSPAMRSR